MSDKTAAGEAIGKVRLASKNGETIKASGTDLASMSRILSTDVEGKKPLVSKDAQFAQQGVLVFTRDILDSEMKTLRAGGQLAESFADFYVGIATPDQKYTTSIRIQFSFKDYERAANTVFFGDRPLDNPGYSKMELGGEVRSGNASNDRLDVLKVEQRLKYLGFPAMGTGNPTRANNQIQDFTVDGTFGEKEKAALKLFEKTVRYRAGTNTARMDNDASGADGRLEAVAKVDQDRDNPTEAQLNADQGYKTLHWLNAYNSPHWMQYYANAGVNAANQPKFASQNASLTTWRNQQLGGAQSESRRLTAVETFGTSWMYDLMLARQNGHPNYLAGLPQGGSWFNGVTDANHGYTPSGHSSHDVGMAMDLGVNPYISAVEYQRQNDAASFQNTVAALIVQADQPYQNVQGWSDDRALVLANTLRQLRNGTVQNQNTGNDQSSALKDFLSLYAVTQSASDSRSLVLSRLTNGTPTQKQQIGDALFGAAGRGLIQGVLVGSPTRNQYTQMHSILGRLNIPVRTWADHEHHFHIYLQPPKPVSVIKTSNLVAQSAAHSLAAPASNQEIQVAAVENTKPSTPSRKLATCGYVSFNPDLTHRTDGLSWFSPVLRIERYFQDLPQNRNIRFELDPKEAKIQIVQAPKHATISLLTSDKQFNEISVKRHNPEYFGRDKMVLDIDYKGQRYRVDYSLVYIWDAHAENKKYGKCDPVTRVIGSAEYQPFFGVLELDASPASWTSAQIDAQNQLAWIISIASGQILEIADLPATALGQTVGEGASAAITLDTNAAGHGWYVDPTPLDNADDYLPTSQAGVWQAKAGTDAAGKMDMLSVLLHEYGHALGLEHSAEAGDFMNASLQPGMRKMPTAEQLFQMSQLVAQLKAGDAGSDAADHAGHAHEHDHDHLAHTEHDHDQPGSPSSPLSMLGLLPFGFVRRNGSSPTTSNAGSGVSVRTHDYMTAVNPTLVNGKFHLGANTGANSGNGLEGWESFGAVQAAANAAGNAANPDAGQTITLMESTGTAGQTRLAQAFSLTERDRFLTFTVTGLDLQNNSTADQSAPQDAFEVALLNANTGLPVMWNAASGGAGGVGSGTANSTGIATSKSDALLNIQRATSRMDAALSERAASGVSHIDNADGSRTYIVNLAGIAANTAANLRDGTFSYAPAGNFFGQDSFTYRYTDGSAASQSEIGIVTINLMALDADNTPATLQFVIQNQPMNGTLTANADGSLATS